MTETLLNGLILVTLGALLAGLGYCIKSIWRHDAQIAAIEARIANILDSRAKGDQVVVKLVEMVHGIDKKLTKVAAKLDVEINEGG